MFLLGVAQLVVFTVSPAVFDDFAAVILGVASIAVSCLLAFKDNAQVFTVVREEQGSLPIYATPSPTLIQMAPPAYTAPALTPAYMKN